MAANHRITLTSACLYTEDDITTNTNSTVASATVSMNAVKNVSMTVVCESRALDPSFVNLIRHREAGFPDDCKEI